MSNKNNHAVSGFMIGLSHMTDRKKRPGKAPFGNLPGRFILFSESGAIRSGLI